ncbi:MULTISPECIES: PTS sugar transporter subunit IIA [Lacrimispora]|jgi:PTS system beta-glucosides-specific IIC component|uniref:PTS sugar transporter subunit IIA n=1 Tax=Lacrimispora TaxID=2719231 RepID=UPI00044CFA13|nr:MULTISPECIES: PTS glucose transporter subunit IIA [Lacrimispora]EXG86947.1 PTS system protein IIA component, Glc family [Clostridium sp. ASBs410]MDR7812587.1 PTS glucose transporter subunit IIA [Lacrimispora sp.]SEU31206.1 PTS system IIA component, Glc family [Lacrimispora sphenoides]
MFDSLKKIFGGGGEKEREKILAPVEGTVVPLSEVNDPTFSQEILGKGVAIIPAKGRIVAPADGILTVVFETKHAVSITTPEGAEIIVHVGLDTVNLKGEHYTAHKKQGDKVKAGELLLEFDMAAIKEAGYEVITPVIVCNTPNYPDMVCHTGMQVKELEPIIEL